MRDSSSTSSQSIAGDHSPRLMAKNLHARRSEIRGVTAEHAWMRNRIAESADPGMRPPDHPSSCPAKRGHHAQNTCYAV